MSDSTDISIITLSYNDPLVLRALVSVSNQSIEAQRVVIDGGSKDPLPEQVRSLLNSTDVFVSERDDGIYDALNKGIRRCSGNIIGMLHADDVFASDVVLEIVKREMDARDLEVAYGDLDYVNRAGRKIRHWSAGHVSEHKLRRGWMPPHPTLFVRRRVFERVGVYDTAFRIAGDYDFLLRVLRSSGIRVGYIPLLVTRMTLGGASNRSLAQFARKSREDMWAVRRAGMKPCVVVPLKILRKLPQFIVR